MFVASIAPTDPLLYWRLFNPEALPSEAFTDADLWQPESEADWEAMVDAWLEADKQMAAAGERRPFAETIHD